MNRVGSILSGVFGGLVVGVVGAVLVATGVIETGETREVVRQGPVTRDAAATDARTVSDIYRREGRGVVFIEARGVRRESSSPFGGPQGQGTATGSGFVVGEDGTIVTNAHVVEGADSVTVRFDEKGDRIDAKVRGRDPSSDLAVLQIDPKKVDLQPLPLGDSDQVNVGDPAVAIGNPFGLSRTVTTGIVSAKQRQIEAPNGFQISNVIQTDASINPGNSGGPLLDAAGRVIGINSQIATGSGGGGSVGIGFAVPVNTAKKLLPRLRDGERIERAYLGVEMAPVTEGVASDLNLPTKEGALLQVVVPRGPADRAGLRGGRTPTSDGIRAGGDLLVKVAGRDIKDPDDVAAAIEGRSPGVSVEVEYFRGKDRKTASVKLGKRPAQLTSQRSQPNENSPLPIP
ncbi:MAG: trypsin-like peptidase domain-containing protein [Thermoleophilaceae bacterium]|nr:trypsin-like peptidase domain-containing protein [Thermoleophilaceae bacterium]